MHSRQFRERAVVIAALSTGEKDLEVSLFSEEQGLLRAVAKGARHNPSRFGPYLLPGSIGIYHFYRARRLHVTQCEGKFSLLENLSLSENSLEAQALLARIRFFLFEGKPHPRLFAMLEKFLPLYSRPEPLPFWMWDAFFIKLLVLMGIAPQWGHCTECRLPWGGGIPAHLSPSEGLVVCPSCLKKTREREGGRWLSFSSVTMVLLTRFKGSPFSELLTLSPPNYPVSEVFTFYRELFSHHLQWDPPFARI